MIRVSETEFSILPNGFDFDPIYDPNETVWRNSGNLGGMAVNYNLWLGPGPVLVPVVFGGPYDVIFHGNVSIPRKQQ